MPIGTANIHKEINVSEFIYKLVSYSNFEGNFISYVFGKSFGHYRDLKSECWSSRHILSKKILNFFICVRFRILCKKVNYV